MIISTNVSLAGQKKKLYLFKSGGMLNNYSFVGVQPQVSYISNGVISCGGNNSYTCGFRIEPKINLTNYKTINFIMTLNSFYNNDSTYAPRFGATVTAISSNTTTTNKDLFNFYKDVTLKTSNQLVSIDIEQVTGDFYIASSANAAYTVSKIWLE